MLPENVFFHWLSTDFSTIFSKLYFSKCTRLAHLLSFESLLPLLSSLGFYMWVNSTNKCFLFVISTLLDQILKLSSDQWLAYWQWFSRAGRCTHVITGFSFVIIIFTIIYHHHHHHHHHHHLAASVSRPSGLTGTPAFLQLTAGIGSPLLESKTLWLF